MNRLFSVFPSGPAGVALLLLRLSAASLMSALIYLNSPPQWLSVCHAIVAIALLIGLLAQFAAAICAGLVMLSFLTHHGSVFDVVVALHAIDAVAIGLLGPGAYSLDSHLFGRRVIEF